MSRNLILIISIFSFWLFIYLSNIADEQKKEEKKDNFADDDVKYTSNTTKNNNSHLIINPVKM